MGSEEVQASHFPACMKKSRILGESKLVAALPEVDALTHRAPRIMTELLIWLDCRSRPVHCLKHSWSECCCRWRLEADESHVSNIDVMLIASLDRESHPVWSCPRFGVWNLPRVRIFRMFLGETHVRMNAWNPRRSGRQSTAEAHASAQFPTAHTHHAVLDKKANDCMVRFL